MGRPSDLLQVSSDELPEGDAPNFTNLQMRLAISTQRGGCGDGAADYDKVSPLSPVSPVSPCSDARFCEPEQTLIFVDWDDTLFPTTDLFDRWGLPSHADQWDGIVLSEEQERGLVRWREALYSYLRTACSLSERCVVLTNARRPWVEDCVDRFAPNLRPIFEAEDGPKVVYARETLPRNRWFPGCARGNPVKFVNRELLSEELEEMLKRGKFLAMRREAKAFYAQYQNQTWKNILSVGDSRYEYDAAQDLAFRRRRAPRRERLRVKAVITPGGPPLANLTWFLRVATLLWPAYVYFDGDLDLNLNGEEALLDIAAALGMPELPSAIKAPPPAGAPAAASEEEESELVESLVEVAYLVHRHISE